MYHLPMTLRLTLAAAALLAAPVAQAADPSPANPNAETSTRGEAPRTSMPRKLDRKAPGTPARPRIFDAPGAALMMIPAAWNPFQARDTAF